MPHFAHFPRPGESDPYMTERIKQIINITFCTVVKWANRYQNLVSDLTTWRANQLLDPIQAPMKRQV